MAHAEILIALAGVLVVLAGAARKLQVPIPIILVAGGVGISLIPGLPAVRVSSEVIFLVFLPPLLYAAGYNSSPRELRTQARGIAILATALVAASAAGVALALRLVVPGFAWPEAFVLGAILAPTDPIAAVAVMARMRVAPRIAALIEGESLVNDGVGLVIYRVAVGATVSGTFSLVHAGGELILNAAGGIVAGLVLARIIELVRARIDDAQVEISLSLFTPYLAYLAAESLHVSGILAAVTVGLYLGLKGDGLFSPAARLEAKAFWQTLTFLLESTLFLLMGLQFAAVARRIEDLSPSRVALAVAVTMVVVTGLRILWMYTVGPALRAAMPGEPKEEPPKLSAAERLVVGWSGMRGGVSLAAALAIPATVQGGDGFPQRDLIVFVTFCVIVLGLTVQGLTLPLLIRRLGLEGVEDPTEGERLARVRSAEVVLSRLDAERVSGDDVPGRVRDIYESRLARSRARTDDAQDEDRRHARDYGRLRIRMLEEERRVIRELHEEGEITEESMRNIERDLDLDEARLVSGPEGADEEGR